jgi:hypothetical protein
LIESAISDQLSGYLFGLGIIIVNAHLSLVWRDILLPLLRIPPHLDLKDIAFGEARAGQGGLGFWFGFLVMLGVRKFTA